MSRDNLWISGLSLIVATLSACCNSINLEVKYAPKKQNEAIQVEKTIQKQGREDTQEKH